MPNARRWLWLCAVLVPVLAGCQNTQWQRVSWLAQGQDQPPQRTSMVLDTPQLLRLEQAEAAAQGPEYGQVLPWWTYRRDVGPEVLDGYRTPIYEQTVTYTYTSQVQNGRHVADYINATTYSVQGQQSER